MLKNYQRETYSAENYIQFNNSITINIDKKYYC